MTTEQLTHLRWLLANGDTLAGSHELAATAVHALPELLDAAEAAERYRLKTLAQDSEIAKLREALAEMIDDHEGHCTDSAENACGLVNRARAALKGGAK